MTALHQTPGGAQHAAQPAHTGKPPRFSVILCTYNRRDLVLSTLASLRRQTLPYAQFEVIVVDNGSTDGTLNTVRAYVSAGMQEQKKTDDTWRVQCLAEPRSGLAHARNTGLHTAAGDIAVFLDDDALADPHFLEQLMQAYDQTGADAIGGRVEIRWEAPRPHWVSEDLLEQLGYFSPFAERRQVWPGMKDGLCLSNCNFSVKVAALRAAGKFRPFLSKRPRMPMSMEIQDVCQRLYDANKNIWYEPRALVMHRVPAQRLQRSYFVGRAYWQGRYDVLTAYARTGFEKGKGSARPARTLLPELARLAYLFFVQRPLLRLAARSSNERLKAAMEQAHRWGFLQQRVSLLHHAPAEMTTPAVLLVHTNGTDPSPQLLSRALARYEVNCAAIDGRIPLAWLWQQRRRRRSARGIIHFYRPGALQLSARQSGQLWFRLWLARSWGIHIVATDAGGWWQSTRGLPAFARQLLERRIISLSRLVLSYTRQPERLYPQKKLRRRARCLLHPGFRGYYPQPAPLDVARQQLGLPRDSFVYVCLANNHTEKELLALLSTFAGLKRHEQLYGSFAPAQAGAQLLLVGAAGDQKTTTRILEAAAFYPAVHLALTFKEERMPFYLGAANAVVLPHTALPSAGSLHMAMLALSYERAVVAPDLPRFAGMLPPEACVYYQPASAGSLGQALLKVQRLHYALNQKEAEALDAASSWNQYAQRLLTWYQQLLSRV